MDGVSDRTARVWIIDYLLIIDDYCKTRTLEPVKVIKLVNVKTARVSGNPYLMPGLFVSLSSRRARALIVS